MAERLTFILDGRDNLSPAFRHAGESAEDFRRRVNHVVNSSGGDLRAFTQDADGRLRTLDGRFVSTGDSARRLQGDMNQLRGPMRGAAAATGEASAAGGSLTPILIGIGAVLGTSLLPALGALVPMMAGAGLAAGTLKLGFAGVSDAVTAAGEDQKKYKEALKKMSPEARTFTKEVVSLKKEFGGLGKDIQKAMLPGFTSAVKSAGPVVKILGKGMTELGKGFGEAAAGAGRLFKSGGFQRDLQTNLDLGMQFVRGLSGGLGTLVQSVLKFGAASGPTLKSFTTGLSGMLGKALPGMFKGLEVGIGGAAKFLDGFFSMVNKIIPAIGRFSGELARSLGPLFGEMFKSAGVQTEAALDSLGKVLKALTPVFKDLGFGLKAARDLMGIFAPVIRDVGSAITGALLPSFSRVDEARGPLQRLSEAISNNKGTIQEVARIMGNAFIDVASSAIENLPKVLGIFRVVTGGMVVGLGGVLHALAETFGFLPGIGDKFKSADRKFGEFKDSYMDGLAAAERKTRDFADGALPKLEQGKLKMNISNWQSQIETAKAKLKTLPPERQAKVKGNIADLQAKIRQAKADLAAMNGRTATTYIKTVRTVYSPPGHTGPGGIPMHAKGTPSAAPGWAWVGEEGPELVRFRGGERVYDHTTSTRMASGVNGRTPVGAGQDAGRGLMAGLGSAAAGVESAARRMAAAVTAGIRGELQIASPSKRTKALAADAGKGLIVGLTGSRDKIKAVSKDLAKDIWAAFTGSKDNKLVAMVNRETKKLLDAATKRDALIAKIKAAKAYAGELTTNAREGASLGGLGIEEGKVTAGSIQAGLQQKLANMRQFMSYINSLAKRGLSKTLLRQILDMGPDAGYAYASALAGASSSTLKSINSTQSQISKTTTKLGQTGADILYDSGKNAGKGFLKGLESQQDAIEKQMVKIAKGMQKAIKKALGIKSPSTVMAQLGRYSTEGLARGLTQPMPLVDRALGAITDRVASAQPVIGRPATAGGGAGTTVINLNIDVRPGGVADWEEIRRGLLSLKRTHGTTVNLGLG
ncbi:hypothetical protein OG911_27970 [Streptomyces sp. NBC_00208]|uniref:hypothetical protein n=1 Tax=Streptomyces sp. NBC_00208 TaxID=2975681 RepID=UPI002E2A3238|nr:hypothetical protein [Streptomyces sp. NBC_00208]